MEYSVSNAVARITVSTKGGELKSFVNRDNNKEYMWQGKAPFWTGTAPQLFPICGRVKEGKYTYKGTEYAIKSPHGFIRITDLDLREVTETGITFGLKSNETTKKAYPFDFDYSVHFELDGKKVTVTQSVTNTDSDTMIFAMGAHPGFNVPMHDGTPFEKYYIEFDEKAEPEEYVCEAAYPTGEMRPFKLEDGKKLALRHNLFDNDAIILKNVCRRLTIKSDDAPEFVRFICDDFRNMGIWHTNETTAPFVCIEPWNGIPSLKDAAENLETKVEMSTLAPGKTYTASYSVEIG